MALATWAVEKMRPQSRGPPIARSGTTTESPGCKAVLKEVPLNKLLLELITEPSARITKAPFLFPSSVAPPAWLRYHAALLPGRYAIAVGLNTCPVTNT